MYTSLTHSLKDYALSCLTNALLNVCIYLWSSLWIGLSACNLEDAPCCGDNGPIQTTNYFEVSKNNTTPDHNFVQPFQATVTIKLCTETQEFLYHSNKRCAAYSTHGKKPNVWTTRKSATLNVVKVKLSLSVKTVCMCKSQIPWKHPLSKNIQFQRFLFK
jgi:hypothetical protein